MSGPPETERRTQDSPPRCHAARAPRENHTHTEHSRKTTPKKGQEEGRRIGLAEWYEIKAQHVFRCGKTTRDADAGHEDRLGRFEGRWTRSVTQRRGPDLRQNQTHLRGRPGLQLFDEFSWDGHDARQARVAHQEVARSLNVDVKTTDGYTLRASSKMPNQVSKIG